jgi:aspartyl protease family protein
MGASLFIGVMAMCSFRISCLLYIVMVLCLFTSRVVAAPSISVVGLFKDVVIVQLSDQRMMLKKGKRKHGLLLISSDAKSALIEFEGEKERYYLKTGVGGQYIQPEFSEVVIAKNAQRRYYTAGSINGLPVSFVVDTGATDIAMNRRQATKLGIDYRLVGEKGQAVTASGVTRSYFIQLERVKIGDIELKHVDAMVIDGDFPVTTLLGMSFLERVEMTEKNGVLRLRKKF